MRKKLKQFVNPRFARKGEYSQVIKNIISEGHCPFCSNNFKYHKKPVLKTKRNWFITESSWPYKNSKHHFLIISKKHKENFTDLTIKDFEDVKYLVNWNNKNFKINGGGLTLRFGDTNYTGSTVAHLHFHLITPKMKHKKSSPVYFPIG